MPDRGQNLEISSSIYPKNVKKTQKVIAHVSRIFREEIP